MTLREGNVRCRRGYEKAAVNKVQGSGTYLVQPSGEPNFMDEFRSFMSDSRDLLHETKAQRLSTDSRLEGQEKENIMIRTALQQLVNDREQKGEKFPGIPERARTIKVITETPVEVTISGHETYVEVSKQVYNVCKCATDAPIANRTAVS